MCQQQFPVALQDVFHSPCNLDSADKLNFPFAALDDSKRSNWSFVSNSGDS